MPQITMDLEVPDKEDVSVRPARQYATLWSQYLSDTAGSKLLYILFGPFFFIRFCIVSFYASSLVIAKNPQVYPIHIPSTANDVNETPIAYTATETFESVHASYINRITRLPSLLYFLGKAYLSQEPIAYIVLNEEADTMLVDESEYFVTEDDDSLRPIILFRD